MLHHMTSIFEKPCNLTHVCQICPAAKQARRIFQNSSTKTSARFELIHLDIWGPFKEPTYNHCKYFATIVDDFSRMC